MADTEAVITIRAVGGDESAAEIDKANNALTRTASSSANLEATFQRRFQHVGLMLFAGDALRASGLGRETRIVIESLNLALTAGAEAAGLSSGGILLVVAALGALAGILVKVIEHHKSHLDALEKSTAATQKNLEEVDKSIQRYKTYAEAGGHLTATQRQLIDATEGYATALKSEQIVALTQMLSELEANRKAIIDHAQVMALWHKYTSDAAVVWGFLKDRVAEAVSPLTKTLEILKEHLGVHLALGHAVALNAKDQADLNLKLAENNKKYAETNDLLNRLQHGYLTAGSTAVDAENKKKESLDRYVKRLEEAGQIETQLQREIDKDKLEQHNKAYQAMEGGIKHYTQVFTSSMTGAFEETLFKGKDFASAFEDAMIKMFEHIIAEVVALIAVWSILDIVSGGATGSPIAPGSLSSFMKAGLGFGGAKAAGGTSYVDKPTLFVAGEGGPEMATFTPLSSMGAGSRGEGGGMGPSITIGSVNTTVQGVNNPDAIAKIVGLKIIQEIRGMGQVNFVRG